jgi:hypothetical protein
MIEASDGKATFKDVQEDTFVRFCQLNYTEDYATPEFIHKPDVELQSVFASDRDDSGPDPALSHSQTCGALEQDLSPKREGPIKESAPADI